MKTSSDFHTGGVLLLTATVICGALAVTVIAPLLQRESFANTNTRPAKKSKNTDAEKAEKFSEFFPSIDDARKELKRFDSVAGPVPSQTRPQEPPQTQPRLNSYFASTPPDPGRTTFGSTLRRPQMTRNAPPQTLTTPLKEPAEPQTVQTNTRQTIATQPVKMTAAADVDGIEEGDGIEDADGVGEAGAVAVEPVVTAGQLIPPSQLPSGSVYAPVTVNVDSSAISQQMKEFTDRFEELIVEKNHQVSTNEVVQPKRQVARRRPRNRQSRNTENRIPDEQIVRIEAGLKELTKSLHSLRDETQSELRELARRNDRADMATRLLESYERSVDERIRQVTDAAKSLPGPPPTKVAIAPKTTRSDAVPLPVERAPQPGNAFPIEPTESPQQERDELQDPVDLSKPVETESELRGKEFSLTSPDSNSSTLPTIVIEDTTFSVSGDSVPMIAEDIESHADEPAQTAKHPVPVVVAEPAADPVAAPVAEPSAEFEQSPADDGPLKLFAPMLLDSDGKEPQAEKPIELSPPASRLSPVPSSKIVESIPPEHAEPVVRTVPSKPVGFENVYRFKLANVESNPVVVPGDGPVCKKCGKVHGPGELHQQKHQPTHVHPPVGSRKLVQTSAKSESETTGSKPRINEVLPPKTTPHNRNAGRGSNRHVRKSRENDSEKPVWDAELPSLNRNSNSPGLFHRLGSTIRQFGR